MEADLEVVDRFDGDVDFGFFGGVAQLAQALGNALGGGFWIGFVLAGALEEADDEDGVEALGEREITDQAVDSLAPYLGARRGEAEAVGIGFAREERGDDQP